ncbi:IAP repeat-containing protein 5 [Tyrophagus putrescentiae]|nr:IAP repeat-containing protein 5 [Tyrophagus putrescentiae]
MSDSNRGYNPEMIDELKRLATLKGWPHKRGACTKEKMAQAGFYRTLNSSAPDDVECFVCFITLSGWEANEEPFEEHNAHSPECPFAQARKPQDELKVGEWIEVLRVRNDKINERRLKSMQGNLQEKINQLMALCDSKKD